jgi:hypothetical protein
VTLAPVAAFSDSAILRAILPTRLRELSARGGECAAYAAVLGTAVDSGKVTLRPFMWRVNGRLASAQAWPKGAIVAAREIDSLNVGARRVGELLASLEHESAHIVLGLPAGDIRTEWSVDDLIRRCDAFDAANSGP